MKAFGFLKKPNIKSMLTWLAVAALCAAVCIGIFHANITPSVALEQELRCGIREHVHTDACYAGDLLVCTIPAHSHDGNCYIVLLNENDINSILSMLGGTGNRSLEYIITDVVSSALVLNANLNTPEDILGGTVDLPLNETTVSQLNSTITEEEDIPQITLNEKINNSSTLAADSSTFAVGAPVDPTTGNYNANFYIYLDRSWKCIGTLQFSRTGSNSNYNPYKSTVPTEDVLELVNTFLGKEYVYNSFDISVSSNQNNGYSTTDPIGMASVQTTLYQGTSNSTSRSTKYVRLIPRGSSSGSNTGFGFCTVTYEYPNGATVKSYERTGEAFNLPSGNYKWTANGTEYNAGDSVTLSQATTFTGTLLGPPSYVNIVYDVNFPTVSGVTVTTRPTLAGLTVTTQTDEYTEGAEATIRNLSQQSVEGKVSSDSTGLGRVIQFRGWRVGNSDEIIQPNTRLLWEEIVRYSNNSNRLELTAVWDTSPLQTAAFYIRFDSVAVDTDGNITGQDSNKYTRQIFAAYVGGIDPGLGTTTLHDLYHIADTTADNSFGADQEIRALYGEKSEGAWLSAFPEDEYVFQELVQYANTGYLSVDGVAVKAEDLNEREYAIRWYVFKAQNDAWHIDGKLVRKVGLIHVYKTFAGNAELVSEAKEDFYIDALDVSTGVNTVLDLNNRTSYNAATDTYMWEIRDVDYGELWTITEHPHAFTDTSIEFSVFSEYTVMDALGDQSVSGTGTSMTVSGMTYALDEGTDEVLRAEFTNIYNRRDSIVIKKQDSRTGVSIGGAHFRLQQNGQDLKFRKDTAAERYIYDPAGTETNLVGTANGYFEICVENISYDLGPITVLEVTPPTGYTPIGAVEIGHTDSHGNVGIISGNSDLINYHSGVLIVGNSTEASTVTAKKIWDCPESEWQPVTLQLLANGKLVTSVIAGVQAEVSLSGDNNWQHTWENLPVYVNGEKINWTIRETRIGSEGAKSDGSFVNWIASYGIPVKTTAADGSENTLLTVTNTTKRVMLRLTKTNFSKTTAVGGAAFKLEIVDAAGAVLPGEIVKEGATAADGTLVFDNLKSLVRYRLTETATPAGYLPMTEYIYFTIAEDGAVTVEESYYAEAGNTAYNITVFNAEAVDLPDSGGPGSDMFRVLGLALCAVAIGRGIYTFFAKRRYQNSL